MKVKFGWNSTLDVSEGWMRVKMGVAHTLEGTLFAFESGGVLPRLASNARNS